MSNNREFISGVKSGALFVLVAGIVCLCSFYSLNGCAHRAGAQSTAPVVQFTVPPHQEQVCPPEQGCIAFQSAKFLELRFGPAFGTEQAGFAFRTTQAMHVTLLDAWIGTNSNDVFESDSRLQIVWPDGSFQEFKVQFDKHSAGVKGDVQRSFNVDLDLPIGTLLNVYHSQQGVIDCKSPAGCGYDSTWSLYAQ